MDRYGAGHCGNREAFAHVVGATARPSGAINDDSDSKASIENVAETDPLSVMVLRSTILRRRCKDGIEEHSSMVLGGGKRGHTQTHTHT